MDNKLLSDLKLDELAAMDTGPLILKLQQHVRDGAGGIVGIPQHIGVATLQVRGGYVAQGEIFSDGEILTFEGTANEKAWPPGPDVLEALRNEEGVLVLRYREQQAKIRMTSDPHNSPYTRMSFVFV